jgi:hypothetical protein
VLRDLGDAAVADIVTRWSDAWHAGDVDAIVAMLADDARYSMPPLPEWHRGEDEIRAFLLRGPLQSRWRFLPTTANGQLAFGTYLWGRGRGGVRSRRPRRPHPAGRIASQRLPPSSPPTSPASGCQLAFVPRADQPSGRQ